MTLTDYIVDLALIAVVIRQMRTRELSLRSMILPIWLVAIAAFSYLRPVPVSAHNVVLVGILVAAGGALGVLSGMATRVWRTSDGALFARAGLLAAFFWVAGMTARFAFAVYATHWGQGAVTQFSIEHGITGAHIWPGGTRSDGTGRGAGPRNCSPAATPPCQRYYTDGPVHAQPVPQISAMLPGRILPVGPRNGGVWPGGLTWSPLTVIVDAESLVGDLVLPTG
jgi:hypothetical protein